MRTTISIDDDIVREAKQYAKSRSLRLGQAISELLRQGLRQQRPARFVNGLRVFDLPADSPRIATEEVEDLEAGQ